MIVPADLEPKELLVYAWLYKHSNQTKEDYKGLSKNEVYASSRKIAEATEIPQSTVTRILKNLIKESYIKEVYKSKSTRESSKYFLSFNESVFGSVSESVRESVNESVSESVVAIETTSLEGNQKTINESVSESVYGSVNESVGDSISNNISINKSNNISNIYKDQVEEVWNYYVSNITLLGITRKKTDGKLKHIRARLADKFTVEQLNKVIDLVFSDPWMMGNNPQKKKYIEIDNIFRNAEKIEKWLLRGRENATVNKPDIKQQQEETEGDFLARRAIEKYGDTLGDIECDF